MSIYDKLNIIGVFIANIMHIDGSLSAVIIILATLIVYMGAVQMKLVHMFTPRKKVQETMDSGPMETLRLL
jgi:predicted branched-subunit amino acid permease